MNLDEYNKNNTYYACDSNGNSIENCTSIIEITGTSDNGYWLVVLHTRQASS